ncbi:hypothetical protein [Paraburkholderia hospita]|uniref:Uncharacterized protein n=1 Tax=Paraburkholderia hospita TaxID=169430 RepID=A0AAN1J4H0_9BURK|nr:hypothetical protein [Paraburkholderia hospita]AUT67153.1 hypothetical protein C2L64_01435 [Paraburkholderia hospita]SEH42527.1 hypothetical protein SAMN05192544_1001429 [Paraburkholderia hospita]
MSEYFEKFNRIINHANSFTRSCDPFREEIQLREKRRPSDTITHDALFEKLCKVVAYSQGAKSKSVDGILDNQLKHAVAGYQIVEAAKLNPLDVVEDHWERIKGIRKKTKIFHMIQMARNIVGTRTKEGIGNFLADSGLPDAIKSEADIDTFWSAFHVLRARLIERDFPFVKEQTSLLHLLMEFGFDCAKPDSAVLKAALRMGLISSIPAKTGRKAERACEDVVRKIQHYALARCMRPPVVDWYLLLEGGQTGALEKVKKTGYAPLYQKSGA